MTKEYFIDEPTFLELSCELADRMLQKKAGKNYKKFITVDKKGVEVYTDKAQLLFEEYLEEVTDILVLNNICPDNFEEDVEFMPDLKLVDDVQPEAKILPFKGQIGAISGEKKDE
jgi:hypothetical protein